MSLQKRRQPIQRTRALDIGGQAVIEGVMMKHGPRLAVAVRRPDRSIAVKQETLRPLPKILRLPFIRGTVTLIHILIIGIRALIWSANQSMGEDEELSTIELAGTLALSIAAALLFFLGVPFLTAHLTGLQGISFNIIEGIVRLAVFIGYVYAISFMKDIRRMFQYHGAEHMAANCYEFGDDLTIKNIRKYSTIHPRCGTSFIMLVLVISIALFSFITADAWHLKLAWRFILIPVIAGISYEILRLGGKFRDSVIMGILIAPGRWVQRITTQQPDDGMVEVAIKALEVVTEKQTTEKVMGRKA